MVILSSSSVEGEVYYNNFINSMKSPATKQLYTYCLNRYMQYCHYLNVEDLLVKGGKEPRLIEASIIQYIVWLKQDQKLSPISVEHYLSALDPKVSAKDRIEAERLKIDASIAITKLEVEGTTITQVNQYGDRESNDNNINLIGN